MPLPVQIGAAVPGQALTASGDTYDRHEPAGGLFGSQGFARWSLRRRDRDIRWPEAVYGPHIVQHSKDRLWQRQSTVQVGEGWRPRTHRVPGAYLPSFRRLCGSYAHPQGRRPRPHRTIGRVYVTMGGVMPCCQDGIEQWEAMPVDRDVTLHPGDGPVSWPVQVRCWERKGEERNECHQGRLAQRPQPDASRRNMRRPDAT